MIPKRRDEPDSIPAVVVTCTADAAPDAAAALAQSLGLPFHIEPAATSALHLVQAADHLELCEAPGGARLRVDYTAAELRRYRGAAGPDPLRRAVGPGPRRVIDATAGLGRDAVHLAVLGYEVEAIERHPVVAALACDGLARARAAGLLPAHNPLWHTGDARALLPALAPAATVYLDPMFPPRRKKSAAVRKEMSLLRRLVADDDVAELFALARAHATERVVVKRPIEAPPLATPVSACYRGKLVRYDVYKTPR